MKKFNVQFNHPVIPGLKIKIKEDFINTNKNEQMNQFIEQEMITAPIRTIKDGKFHQIQINFID